MKKQLLLVLLISLGLLIRFYNYPQRINFGPEQGLALLTSGDYLNNGFSLLGQKTFLRTTSVGHVLFSGALYNYSLVPLLLLFNYQPLPITICFTLLNILTGLAFYFVVKKIFGLKSAEFSLIIFLFSDLMIFHSMFIWILDYLPLIGILSLYYFWRYRKQSSWQFALILGILSGVGVNLEYIYLFTAALVFFLILIFSKNKFRDSAIFILGCGLGDFTMVLFDLKHDFYYTRTLWQYFIDTLKNPGQSQLSYYHFLNWFPILYLAAGKFLSLMYQKSKVIAVFLVVIYVLFNLVNSEKVSFTKAVGMVPGMTYAKLDLAASKISSDQPENFNLSYLPDADFRAYALRYLLTYVYKNKPQSLENYSSIRTLYVFAGNNYNFGEYQPWEVRAMNATKIDVLSRIDDNYSVYKLSK